MSKSIFFFLGPHKTATTSMQKLFSEEFNKQNLKNELYIDQHNFVRNGLDKDTFKKIDLANQKFLIRKDNKEFIEDFSSSLNNLINQVYKFEKVIIFNENLIGPMIGHTFAKTHICKNLYPNIKTICNIIYNLTDTYKSYSNIKIIVFKRNFYSWIHSVAKDNFKKKLMTQEKDFLDCISSASLYQYENIYNHDENYYIFEFDKIINEPNRLLKNEIFLNTFISKINLHDNLLTKENDSKIELSNKFKNALNQKLNAF